MTADSAREWVRVVRDAVIVSVATFMLIYETVAAKQPNLYVIGGALSMIGLPPALRLDEIVRASKPKAGE